MASKPLIENSKFEQRAVIKFLVSEGEKASNIVKRLEAVYGNAALGKTAIYAWVERFRSGRISLEDDKRSGRPITSVTQQRINRVDEMVQADRRITLDLLKECTGISRSSIVEILHEVLGYNRVSAIWVAKMLHNDQKRVRLEISEDMLRRYNAEQKKFLDRIITMDGTWIYFYDPETKQQSSQWKHTSSPSPEEV